MVRPTQTDELKFARELWKTTREAAKEGYEAGQFAAMLEQYGGVQTAVKLTTSSDFQSGFLRLMRLGREDLTTEAVMLRPEFSHLFDKKQLDVARWRLEEAKRQTKNERE